MINFLCSNSKCRVKKKIVIIEGRVLAQNGSNTILESGL